jgi:hypothetical protein
MSAILVAPDLGQKEARGVRSPAGGRVALSTDAAVDTSDRASGQGDLLARAREAYAERHAAWERDPSPENHAARIAALQAIADLRAEGGR